MTALQQRWLLKPHTYFDSLRLLEVHAAARTLPGVVEAVCVMATERNLELVRARGLLPSDIVASAEDLLVVLQGPAPAALETALLAVEDSLRAAPIAAEPSLGAAHEQWPRSLDRATQLLTGANVASISVPGAYAAATAARALWRGLHVHLFSDNVSLEDELALKRLAHARGLLMMGPDCGTAIINGAPLGFANVVRRGPVGIVGASGTGTQAATVLLDRLGVGVSHAIGVGGRDLSAEVGGSMTLDALALLEQDRATEAILVISKPPAPATAERILTRVRASTKPVEVCFVGTETIDDAVYRVARHVGAVSPEPDEQLHLQTGNVEIGPLRAEQITVRGLFTGGTLADEAKFVLSTTPGVAFDITDLGDDEFTLGRPHPMIDPSLRDEWLARALAEPSVGVVLCDVVLGYGSHADPGGALAAAVIHARQQPRQATLPVVVASVCGTPADPQRLDVQERKLRAAGILVLSTNAAAARAAVSIVTRGATTLAEVAR